MALIKAKQLDATDNFNFNTVTLGTVMPTLDAQAASKAYVDSVAQGLDVKESVRAATTVNINLASAPASVDGITLAADDRVLVKNQTDASENGIYVFNGIGSAMTRSEDADTDLEVTANLFTFVEEGTSLADTGWVLVSNDPIVVGTDDLTFSQFSGAGAILAGQGLSKTGSTLDVNVDDSTIEINSDILRVKDLGITNAKINDVAASKVTIVDAGTYFTSTDVEGALQELGNSVSSLPTNSAITDLQAAVGSSTGLAGLDYSSNHFITDGTSLETAAGALDAAEKKAFDAIGITPSQTVADLLYSATPRMVTNGTSLEDAIGALDAAAAKSADLASTSNGLGASLIGIQDVGNYFSGVTVEAALQELGLQLAGAGNVDSRLDNIEAVIGSTNGLAGIDFTSNNVLTDGVSLEAALSAIDVFFGSAVTTADFNKLAAITGSAAQINAAVGAAHNNAHDALTVTSNGQTAFTLAFTPKNANSVALFVNGAAQTKTSDFTVSGTTLTWVSTDFALATTDKLVAIYDVAA